MATLTANKKLGNVGGWQERHDAAVYLPVHETEPGVVPMLRGWAVYAAKHFQHNGSPIGEDYVLGPQWEQIGLGIRGLLNGITGRLDCGTLDAFILDTLSENGFDVSHY